MYGTKNCKISAIYASMTQKLTHFFKRITGRYSRFRPENQAKFVYQGIYYGFLNWKKIYIYFILIWLKHVLLCANFYIVPKNIAKLTDKRHHVCTHAFDTKRVSCFEKELSCIWKECQGYTETVPWQFIQNKYSYNHIIFSSR